MSLCACPFAATLAYWTGNLREVVAASFPVTCHFFAICGVGQNRIYTPYITVYLAIFLPKIPCTHRVCMVLANPMHRYVVTSYVPWILTSDREDLAQNEP